jgi:hypothetical protein
LLTFLVFVLSPFKTQADTTNGENSLYSESEVFDQFFSELQDEALKNGEEFDLSEGEARELFELMYEEFTAAENEAVVVDGTHAKKIDQVLAELKSEEALNGEELDLTDGEAQKLFEMLQRETKDFDPTEPELSSRDNNPFDTTDETNEGKLTPQDTTSNTNNDGLAIAPELSFKDESTLVKREPYELTKINELQEALPGLPLGRVKKILRAFESTLGYPSMLTLVPILRETMPDYVTNGWLKRQNNRNAEFALRKASEDGLVDSAILNSMLQVKANSGSIDETLDFYSEEFSKHNLVSAW